MPDDFPYRSHGQPITAYASLAACLFILIVANGAGLWKDFHVQPFLSAYLAVSTTNLEESELLLIVLLADMFHHTMDFVENSTQGPMAPSRAIEWRRTSEEDVEVA
jgi:amino acid permease